MRTVTLCLFLLATTGTLYAQHMLGLSQSNYAGIHGLYINPSSIADNRLGFSFHLSSMDFNASNNYAWYDGDVSIGKIIKGDQTFEDEHIREASHNKFKLFTAAIDYRGPSLMISLSPKHSIGLTTRLRGAIHGNSISDSLVRFLIEEREEHEAIAQASGNNQGNFNANAIAELGLTYARVVYEKGPHLVKSGMTIKKLSGLYSAHLVSRDVRFRVTEIPSQAEPGTEETVMEIDRIQAEYGYASEDFINDFNPNQMLGLFTKGNIPGQGWGIDIGFTYEYRPELNEYRRVIKGKEELNPRKNKYKYRLGLSLTDIGSIRYYHPAYARKVSLDVENKVLNLSDFDEVESTSDYSAVINEALGVQPSDIKNTFTSGLPTMLHVNLDYKLTKTLYLNAAVAQNVRGKYAVAMRRHSLVAVTPRVETKVAEIAFPLSLYNNYQLFGMGAMLKFAGFYVGSDNIGGFFNAGKLYGANLYAGVSILNITKGKKTPKERKVEKQKSI